MYIVLISLIVTLDNGRWRCVGDDETAAMQLDCPYATSTPTQQSHGRAAVCFTVNHDYDDRP